MSNVNGSSKHHIAKSTVAKPNVTNMNDEDESLLEEATLGACLRRVLQGQSTGGSQAEGGELSEALLAGQDCFASGGIEMEGDDRIKKWKEAGVALRKALTETSGGHLQNHRTRSRKGTGDANQPEEESGTEKQLSYKKILERYKGKDLSLPYKSRSKKDESPEIRSVREKIQEIKSRMGDCCKEKEEPHRLRRQRCSRNASFEVNSSESEQEIDMTRQKYVPRCRRTSSQSGSPRIKNSEKIRQPDPTAQYKLLIASPEDDKNGKGGKKRKVTPPGQLVDTDSETDSISRRLENLVHQQKAGGGGGSSSGPTASGMSSLRRLSAVLADSIPNLADIESSPCTEEDAGFGESEIDVPKRTGVEDLNHKVLQPETSSNSSHGADFADLDDLDLSSQGSKSDDRDKPVKLDADDLESLLDILTESAGSAASDQDGEADDEFECDCFVCQQKKFHISPPETQLQQRDNGDSNQFSGTAGATASEYLNIDLDDLTPLDLLLMREGHRDVIEVMFQNVIRQMLSVYPDLINDQAPPPAPPTAINKLPIIEIHELKLAKDSMCPVCLCNFEGGEEARQMPCKHIYHTLCIQAWLNKSGTCPVCRYQIKQSDLL